MHPLNSFAAVGPRAAELVAAQSPTDVYGPIRELAAQNGTILLIGVRLNRMTAIHLAEQQSGRRLFLRWARDTDGQVRMVEVGSCSEGFPALEPTLAPYAPQRRSARRGGAPTRPDRSSPPPPRPSPRTKASPTARIPTAGYATTRSPAGRWFPDARGRRARSAAAPAGLFDQPGGFPGRSTIYS